MSTSGTDPGGVLKTRTSIDGSILCFRCGVCCTDFQPYLKLTEARAIADRLGEGWSDFTRKYADSRWPFADSLLLRHKDGACVFLDRSPESPVSLCRIEDFKPQCCREWQAGYEKKQCRLGLQRYWGLDFNGAGGLQGPVDSINRFEIFLESLV